MSERTVIGIDGGGTRLRAAISTINGELLGTGEAGSGNYHDVGAEVVQANIGAAIGRAWKAASRTPQRVSAIFLGLGSITTPEDRATIGRIVRELDVAPPELIGVDHDLRIAQMAGLGGSAGIVLIVGTGSSCYGRDGRGANWQSGGWGPLLDDPGSSYWLGRQAMIAAVRDFDGRSPSTTLRQCVMDSLGLSDIRQILRRVELEGMTRQEIASLSRMVTDAAASGDAVARSIIDRGVEELAAMVAAVAAQLDFQSTMDRIPVTVTGGLTNARTAFLEPLRKAIERRIPRAAVLEPMLPPVLGAALLAIEMTGTPVGPNVVARLQHGDAVRPQAYTANAAAS